MVVLNSLAIKQFEFCISKLITLLCGFVLNLLNPINDDFYGPLSEQVDYKILNQG